jgi:hypothetical protein
VAAALVVGGLGYGVSITLWVSGARDLGAARGQLVFAAAPFIGAGLAWTAFAEPVAGREVLALVIAAAGVSLVLRSDHAHEHRHDAVEHDYKHDHDDGHHTHPHPEPVAGRRSASAPPPARAGGPPPPPRPRPPPPPRARRRDLIVLTAQLAHVG